MSTPSDISDKPLATKPRPAYVAYSTFKEFHLLKSGISNFELVGQDAAKTRFHVDTSLYNPSKRDIILYEGADSNGKVLGDIDLKNFSGHYTVELGDVDHEPVILEELERIKGWRRAYGANKTLHLQHQFNFKFAGADREAYIWQHPGEALLADPDDLVLVVEDDNDEEDIILARYLKDGGSGGWKGKGGLLIREGGGREWELMVILTVLALLVSRRREQ